MRHITVVVLFCLLGASVAGAQTIETVAGGGPNNMPALEANVAFPESVATDAAGNLYLVSRDLNRVFKVDTQGQLTVVAGNGTRGSGGDGGPATRASLYPVAIAASASGILYIVDGAEPRIRKVDASGTITTVAGNGTYGFSGDGGPATSASLGYPQGVAVDAAGNLYIADGANLRIRKVDASGTITTIAGNGTYGFSGDGGPAISASLGYPQAVAVDATGNLYIVDSGNARIRKVDVSGIITTVAGGGVATNLGDGGPATSAYLNDPHDVAVDAGGNFYIADTLDHRVRKVNAA